MKTRLEADEVAAQLERCDKENKMLKDEMNKEIEAVLSLPRSPPCPVQVSVQWHRVPLTLPRGSQETVFWLVPTMCVFLFSEVSPSWPFSVL